MISLNAESPISTNRSIWTAWRVVKERTTCIIRMVYYSNINCTAVWCKNFLKQKFLEADQKPHAILSYDCSGVLYVWIVHEVYAPCCPSGGSYTLDTIAGCLNAVTPCHTWSFSAYQESWFHCNICIHSGSEHSQSGIMGCFLYDIRHLDRLHCHHIWEGDMYRDFQTRCVF